MNQANSEVRDIAEILLARETNLCTERDGELEAALSALGKIRSYLVKLVGIAGFQALLARALALTTAEVSWLTAVRVQADTNLEGFREAAQSQSAQAVATGSVLLVGQLLGLLVIFIGEALTLRLVEDIWPEAGSNDSHLNFPPRAWQSPHACKTTGGS